MSIKLMTTAFFTCIAAMMGACSSDPQAPTTRPGGSAAGTSSTAGTTGTAGTPSTGGTGFGSGGTGTAGTGFGTGGAGGTGGVLGSAGSIGTGGTLSAGFCKAAGAEVALPMAVDSSFIASGYFAGPEFPADVDTNPNVTGITEAACETRPENEAGHTGNCHKWSFLAKKLDVETGEAYGGVFWQAPANNWGMSPGIKTAAGATKVTFRAWGAVGGEVLSFSAGGITSATCNDDIQLGMAGATQVTLTTTPTDYTVDLKGQTYPNGVIGGFVWSAATASIETPVEFYVDDIQWVQ